MKHQFDFRRSWRNFDNDSFLADLMTSRLCTNLNSLNRLSVDQLVELYDNEMQLLLNKHCPYVKV